jgi:aminomethyltransferase
VWDELIKRGRSVGLVACGLGCRDTLRLEAAMPLYGHELSEATDPITAGLSFAVKLSSKEFIGKSALFNKPQLPAKRRVGIVLAGRRIAREGSQIFAVGDAADLSAADSSVAAPIGEVTSGTFAPTLEKSIAMAYVARESVVTGANIEVDVRGKRELGTIVELPFYRRTT